MSPIRAALSATLLILLTTNLLFAAIPSHPKGQVSEYKIIGGFWRTDATFRPALSLSNVNQVEPAIVTPTLTTPEGRSYDLHTVVLGPGGVGIVQLSDQIETLRAKGIEVGDYGTISVRYTASYEGAVLADLTNLDAPRSLSFTSTFHSEVKATDKLERQLIQGLWWRLDDRCNIYIALTNSSKTDIRVKLTLQSSKNEIVTVPAHQTILFKDWKLLHNLSGKYGAIDIGYTGSVNSISINSGAYDDTRGFSAQVAFYRLGKIHPLAKTSTRTMVSPGMMVGAPAPSMLFPSGTSFHLYAFVRNIGGAPMALAPTLHLADSSTRQLAPVLLAPNSTAEIPVDQAASNANARNMATLALHVEGDPHSLIVQTGSIDDSGTYVLGVLPTLVNTTMSKYICHWLADGDSDTMISIANTESDAQDLILRLNFGHGRRYLVPVHLDKGATVSWNLSELLTNAAPDHEGNLPPKGITEGSAEVMNSVRIDKPIAVAVFAGIFNVRTATCHPMCTYCSGYTGSLTISPNPASMTVGSSVQLQAYAQYSDGYTLSTQNITGGTDWSSADTSIATVDFTGKVSGVGSGSTTVLGQATDVPSFSKECTEVPDCTDNQVFIDLVDVTHVNIVQACPTSIAVGATNSIPLVNGFPSLLTGIGIDSGMQLLPDAHNWDGTIITESVSPGSNSCPNSFPSCSGSSTWTVGGGGSGTIYGIPFSPRHNGFWDEHAVGNSSSLLDSAGINSCQTACNQTYYCNGNPVSSFTIMRSYQKGTIQGQPVTNVTITVQ